MSRSPNKSWTVRALRAHLEGMGGEWCETWTRARILLAIGERQHALDQETRSLGYVILGRYCQSVQAPPPKTVALPNEVGQEVTAWTYRRTAAKVVKVRVVRERPGDAGCVARSEGLTLHPMMYSTELYATPEDAAHAALAELALSVGRKAKLLQEVIDGTA